jgi:hypothetical protein
MEVDRVPLSQLPSRYSIARSAVYTPLKDLQISPSKDSKKAYVNAEKLQLSYLRELEEAYENGWLLSTSEVADLLGLLPKTVASYGREFADAGFVFTRAGTRKRGEIAWTIDKSAAVGGMPQQSGIGIKEAFSSEFDPEDDSFSA